MDHRSFALTPPMGWNSWDCYGAAVNEEQLLGNAAYMEKYLKSHGWEYVVCDIQWSEPDAFDTDYTPLAPLCMDEWGRLLPAEKRFPSAANGAGFRVIGEKIHAMGLKFGIHILRGIPRQAAHARTPILGTDFTAADAADPFSYCAWNSDMYGVRNNAAGQAYYDSIFRLYASWGVDFVKVDDIASIRADHDRYSAKHEVEMIRHAIDACGRAMVLSLSPGPAVIDEAWHLCENANMWRMTDDVWDEWSTIKNMFRRCEVWQYVTAPGNWPDCDMLPVGHLNVNHRKGDRYTRLTHDEQITLMNLWCIFRSPLMVGAELRDNDAFTLGLLTNDDLLALLKETAGARQLRRTEEDAVWRTVDAAGNVYLGLFNLSDEPRCVSACPGVGKGSCFDLWSKKTTAYAGGDVTADLAPHASVVWKFTPAAE